ncbi:isochorismatase family protein [Ideonella sp.]|uniref:isochorismatase family protein n=1 Tax=Ideonella sp. TaxID=1929293 RepID=UPI002B45C566|nr:isochorismatase family protein [Ideonella sp.]HJV71485.1 isochorismatase family protein [Ideonella sp.]
MDPNTDPLVPRQGDALLLVDVQRDFLPGGALGVPGGDRVLAPLNDCIALFTGRRLPVYATRDWHPADHCSFRQQGGPWPPHCVAGSAGAGFADALRLPPDAIVVSKGCAARHEAYSGFAGTSLEAELHLAGVRRLFIGGLATDYCVLQTVLDARERELDVVLIADAVAAVDVQPGDGERALARMQRAGAVVSDSLRVRGLA